MRPTTDVLLMETAWVWSKRATCSRRQVGCVIARNTRILVQGYNGAPAGMPHCDHSCDCYPFTQADLSFEHRPGCRSVAHCSQAQHAERNAIAFAARNGIAMEGATAYVTREPCLNCAWMLAGTGVIEVFYAQARGHTAEGLDYLAAADIPATLL